MSIYRNREAETGSLVVEFVDKKVAAEQSGDTPAKI